MCTTMKLCPKCKNQTLAYQHGCGWDYDRWMCMEASCDYERELECTSFAPEVRKPLKEMFDSKTVIEVKEILNEIDGVHISGFEIEA